MNPTAQVYATLYQNNHNLIHLQLKDVTQLVLCSGMRLITPASSNSFAS